MIVKTFGSFLRFKKVSQFAAVSTSHSSGAQRLIVSNGVKIESRLSHTCNLYVGRFHHSTIGNILVGADIPNILQWSEWTNLKVAN